MKAYLKYPLNLVIFILLMISIVCPIASFTGDAIAYCMGCHHGFTQPWPTIQIFLNWAFPIMLFVFVVDLVVYLILKSKRKVA